MLFIRGKAMSGAPIMSGMNQLPKPPISVGITMKNTMMRPWPVTKTLKACGFEKNCRPGSCSSRRMAIGEKAADDTRREAEDEVERADVLVVRRIEPPAPEGRKVIVVIRVSGISCMCHDETSVVLLSGY